MYFRLGRHIVSLYFGCFVLLFVTSIQSSAVRRCCLFPTPGAFHRHPITLKEIQDLAKPKIFANALSAQTLSVAVPQQEGWRAVEACFQLKIAVTQSSAAK